MRRKRLEALREEFYRLISLDGYNDYEAVIIMAIRHWEVIVLLLGLIRILTGHKDRTK